MNKIILAVGAMLSTMFCFTKNVKIPEPEFSGTIVYVNSNTGNGIPLETGKLFFKAKAIASPMPVIVYIMGIGKATTKATVKGNTSSVKVKKNSIIQFIYKSNENTVNPVDIMQLIRFEEKGSNRETELASAGKFTGTSSGDSGFVQFTAKKYRASSYLITISNLGAGEYGFSLDKEETTTIHMFSVE
jgi:hypothetical protein